MKTQKEIEKEVIQYFGSLQDKITSFGIGSVIRAIFTSVSAVLAEIWNDLNITTRQLFWSTATGVDLDRLGEEEGIVRLGETYAHSICVFKGEYITGTSTSVGTGFLEDNTKSFTTNDFINGQWVLIDSDSIVFTITGNTSIRINVNGNPSSGNYYVLPKLPIGTIVRSATSGLGYITQEEVLVGASNLNLWGLSNSIDLGSRSIVVCQVPGSVGKAFANDLTVLSPAINGILSVTNPVPAGFNTGLDAESDDQFRARRKQYINLLNVDTQAFFEALAIAANSNVLRSIAKLDTETGNIIIYVLNRTGGLFSSNELSAIKEYIELHAKSFITANVYNMVMTDIYVQYECTLKPTMTLQDHYVNVADAIASYLDFSRWEINKVLYDDNIADIILNEPTILDLDLLSLIVSATKNGVPVGTSTITFEDSLPRLARLKVKDKTTDIVYDLVLNQHSISI